MSDTEIIQTHEQQFDVHCFRSSAQISALAEIEKSFAFHSMRHADDSDSVRKSWMEVDNFYVCDSGVGIIDAWLQWTAFMNGLGENGHPQRRCWNFF